MKINKNSLKTTRTARYFTLGRLDETTKIIWFVFHGYAQTADHLLESLQELHDPNTFIIAPEGLSRFYWKDFSSNPVASWMTKLDRESDIEDNQAYLNKLYKSFDIDENEIQVNFLGFSQGTATMSRWIALDEIKSNKIVFYAGRVAHDIDLSKSKNFKKADLIFIYGKQDRFISEENVSQLIDRFTKNGLDLKVYDFEGKHKVCHDGLKCLLQ